MYKINQRHSATYDADSSVISYVTRTEKCCTIEEAIKVAKKWSKEKAIEVSISSPRDDNYTRLDYNEHWNEPFTFFGGGKEMVDDC